MKEAREYDLIVVGGGPAGLSAAKVAARIGIRVLLVEKKAEVGGHVRCAEFLYGPFALSCGAASVAIVQPLRSMVLHIEPWGEIVLKICGCTIDRGKFEKRLAMEAEASGATLITGSRVVALDGSAVIVKRGSSERSFKASFIIGADGANSIIGRAMGSSNARYLAALQIRPKLKENSDTVELFFGPRYRGGYGWLFPKGGEVNLGVGLGAGSIAELKEVFRDFVAEMSASGRIEPPRQIGSVFGLVPAGGPMGKLCDQGLMLAGDAAGLSDPATGAGIAAAVISGELAGRYAAEAAAKGEPGLIKGYEDEVRTAFAYERRLELRRALDSAADIASFNHILMGGFL